MFIRYAAFHLQQLSAKKQRETTDQKSIEDIKETATKVEEDKEKEIKKTEEPKKTEEKKPEVKEKQNKKNKQKQNNKDEVKINDKKEDIVDKEVTVENDIVKETKEEDIMLNENYSEIDTDVAKKIVESITDSICNGDKQDSKWDCIFNICNETSIKLVVLPNFYSTWQYCKILYYENLFVAQNRKVCFQL